jgi:hypothetical protein
MPVPTFATDALYDHGIMDLEISCPPGALDSGNKHSKSWFDSPTRRHPLHTTQFESGQPSSSFSEMVLDFEANGILELEGENLHNFLAVDFD